MHRRPHLAARALLTAAALAAAWACGGDGATATDGLALRFSSAEALAKTATVAIQFYTDDDRPDQCTALRAARPRLRPALGPYRIALSPVTRANGTTFSRDDVPVGLWAILVDANAGDGTLVGSGCAQDQQVIDGQRTSIAVVIDAEP